MRGSVGDAPLPAPHAQARDSLPSVRFLPARQFTRPNIPTTPLEYAPPPGVPRPEPGNPEVQAFRRMLPPEGVPLLWSSHADGASLRSAALDTLYFAATATDTRDAMVDQGVLLPLLQPTVANAGPRSQRRTVAKVIALLSARAPGETEATANQRRKVRVRLQAAGVCCKEVPHV